MDGETYRTHGARQKLLLGKNMQNHKRHKTTKKSFLCKSFVDNFTGEQKHYWVF